MYEYLENPGSSSYFNTKIFGHENEFQPPAGWNPSIHHNLEQTICSTGRKEPCELNCSWIQGGSLLCRYLSLYDAQMRLYWHLKLWRHQPNGPLAEAQGPFCNRCSWPCTSQHAGRVERGRLWCWRSHEIFPLLFPAAMANFSRRYLFFSVRVEGCCLTGRCRRHLHQWEVLRILGEGWQKGTPLTAEKKKAI